METQVQMAIIDFLRKSSAIQTALGFSVAKPGGIYESKNFNNAKATFPRVSVGYNTSSLLNCQQVISLGGKQIEWVYIDVKVYSKALSSAEVGSIDEKIREVLDGQQLNFIGLNAIIEQEGTHIKDRDDANIWFTYTRYKVLADLV